MLSEFLGTELAALERVSLRRKLRVVAGAHGAQVSFAGRGLLMFSSNNYLGLADHPALKQAAARARALRGRRRRLAPLHALEDHPRASRASRRRWSLALAISPTSARSPRSPARAMRS